MSTGGFMKAAWQFLRNVRPLLAVLLVSSVAAVAVASEKLTLARGAEPPSQQYKGVIELTVDPGFEDAKVALTVDGQKIATSLDRPYKVTVDFGPEAVEHRITVTATGVNHRHVQWFETINHGHRPLTVKVQAVDLTTRTFEALTTAPDDDPVSVVELWDSGKLVTSVDHEPYRFSVPAEVIAKGLVQVTARAKSGDEAADFWSSSGDVHVESIQVRTVPLFVSVVDEKGATHDDIDRSLFRVIDGGSEGKIIEFGKAFDQPISIALLIDASASMTYAMQHVEQAAADFIKNTLKKGDRCSIYAVQEVPRRRQSLTADSQLVANALRGINAQGETALYDAIDSAIRELNDEKDRRAIVVLSDGGDNSSVDSYDDVKKKAEAAGIPIYFIAYDTGSETLERDLDQMKNLATETGGFVATAREQDLSAKYREIEKDLRAQFAIRYQVADYAKPNQWRPIRVLVASPKLTARTIRGYFAQ